MEKLKKIFNVIAAIICTIFFGITSIFVIKESKNHEKKAEEKAEEKKEEKKNELEKTSADDIAANSPNADVISSNITKEQQEFRERVRNRLEQNVQRFGSK